MYFSWSEWIRDSGLDALDLVRGKWPLNCAFCHSVPLRGCFVSCGYASACYAT
jgi:hypothetical protein